MRPEHGFAANDAANANATPLLHDYLVASARHAPEKVALVCQGRRLTYAELDRQSDAVARALRARGVARRDRVVVLLENGVEAVVAFWAVLKADAIVTMIHPQTKPNKLAYILTDCGAAALITDAQLARVFEPALHNRELPVLDVESELDATDPAPGTFALPRRNLDIDLAALIYTSGSTGEPKGVMLTHRNMLTACASISEYLQIAADEVILCVLPLAFDYGLYQMIMGFAAGARVVLERSFAFPAQVLKKVVDEKVTGFPGVPTI
ncbi:MAG: hypothetical protein JWP87_430, partial [Labilithrix sp.]|nr:hypothetical protein [Labilithrix sp.]